MIARPLRRLFLHLATVLLIAAALPANSYEAPPGSQLIDAARSGDLKAVSTLLRTGAKADYRRPAVGDTPLMAAAAHGSLDIVRVLLEAGAQADVVSSQGETALRNAAMGGHLKVVEALLAAGAPVNAGRANGLSALTGAVSAGHLDVVSALLAAKADPNSKDTQGRSVLLMAAVAGRADLVRPLLAAGAAADPCMPGHQGCRTALMMAISYSSHQLLMAVDSRVAAGRNPYLEVARVLLDGGANPNATVPNGTTPLKLALSGKTPQHRALVAALVAAGANVNDRPSPRVPLPRPNGNTVVNLRERDVLEPGTALQVVARRGDTELVRLLLDAGADVNATDTEGRTAIEIATEAGHAQVAQMLRSAATR